MKFKRRRAQHIGTLQEGSGTRLSYNRVSPTRYRHAYGNVVASCKHLSTFRDEDSDEEEKRKRVFCRTRDDLDFALDINACRYSKFRRLLASPPPLQVRPSVVHPA